MGSPPSHWGVPPHGVQESPGTSLGFVMMFDLILIANAALESCSDDLNGAKHLELLVCYAKLSHERVL